MFGFQGKDNKDRLHQKAVQNDEEEMLRRAIAMSLNQEGQSLSNSL